MLEAPERRMQQMHLMRDLGLIGGFLVLIALGPGLCSIDARRARG
jgi:uncharacterized membrane protein YphA (DoxX/SURF4 family)